MKKLIIAALVLICASAAQGQGIKFRNYTLPEALAQAAKTGKPVMVDCYTGWCVPCKNMEQNVFPVKEVGDYFNRNFVCIKMDMEKGEGPEVRGKYGISFFPTFMLLNADGELINLMIGFAKPEDFIANTRKAMLSENSLILKKDNYTKSPSLATVLPLIEHLQSLSLDISDVVRGFHAAAPAAEKYDPRFLAKMGGLIDRLDDPILQDICINKAVASHYAGESAVNNFIGERLAAFLAGIAMGTARNTYAEDVVTRAIGMLNMLPYPVYSHQAHIGKIADMALRNDWDAMLDYYDAVVSELVPHSRSRFDLAGILFMNISKTGMPEQKERMKAYFEKIAQQIEELARQYRNAAEAAG